MPFRETTMNTQTKPVGNFDGCTIVGVVGASGQVGPPFSVFKNGSKIEGGFSSIGEAQKWISQQGDDEDEEDKPPSPRPS